MNDTEMTRKASETDCLQASFRAVRGVRAENSLASFIEPTTAAKHEVRATQADSGEAMKVRWRRAAPNKRNAGARSASKAKSVANEPSLGYDKPTSDRL